MIVEPIIEKKYLPHLGPDATLTITRYWINYAQQILMALPSSGQLTLKDIQDELGGSGQASLGAMSDTAGKIAPDQVSDFYGYSSVSNVRWEQPSISNASLVGSPQWREGTGSWTSFSGTRQNTSVTTSTVGYQYTATFVTFGGGDAKCGPTSGSLTYGSYSDSATPSETVTFTLDGVTTAGRSNMYFTGSTG